MEGLPFIITTTEYIVSPQSPGVNHRQSVRKLSAELTEYCCWWSSACWVSAELMVVNLRHPGRDAKPWPQLSVISQCRRGLSLGPRSYDTRRR